MRRLVVGTAGHIDHGKTKLIEALTGIDCDRWAEEKARGITIDLGFAHLEEGDVELGFVDVPGHERFLHNALAGLGGIRAVLLVVAADEGVKPQTREHLAICILLGIPRAVVALTKADLVTPELAELAQLEIEELLASTPYAAAPVIAVSSVSGLGIAELKRHLLDLAAEAPAVDAQRPARLPVDRAFHLRGLGVVVTGTLVSGRVRAGETLTLLPAGAPVKVRGVQVHGRPREQAAGERSALQLVGVELAAIGRGMTLATPGALAATTLLAAELTLLPEAAPLRGWTPVRVHLYAAEVLGRMRPLGAAALLPGATGAVEIRLAAPVAAARGDRFIVRRPSPPATLGGGGVLDPAWRRRRGPQSSAALAALAGGDDEALLFWVREAGERGLPAEEAATRLGVWTAAAAARLAALGAGGALLTVPAEAGRTARWLAPAAFRRVGERARRLLEDHFRRDRLARGMPKAEAVRRLLPAAPELAEVYLEWLQAQGVLALHGDLVDLPGRQAQLTGEESQLARDVLARFEAAALNPPAPAELQAGLGAKPQILAGVVRYLQERGQLVRLPGGLVLAAAAVAELRRRLLDSGWERFTVPQFKERFGLTRKWAIPLLEHLDSTGATRRLGDERQVVRPRAPVT